MAGRYINPYTDFGFKKLFGEEGSKVLLIDFLNSLLPPEYQVASLSFCNPDNLGVAASDRRAVFDIYCESEAGEPFIVEMQKAEQEYFKDRSVYYTAHPIRNQARPGRWNYRLKTVWFIGILDFLYEKASHAPVLIREVTLKDQFGEVFYEKLRYLYIQMPLFTKGEDELKSQQDKWLYFLKNLPSLDHIPSILHEPVFDQAFHTAEIAAMGAGDRASYEQDLNDYRTYFATIETAFDQGRDQGRLDVARSMLREGLDLSMIARLTGLSIAEVERLTV